MSRSRTVIGLLALSVTLFGFQHIQQLIGIETSRVASLPVLFIVLALLTLVLSPKSIVLYGACIAVGFALVSIFQVSNSDTSLSIKLVSFCGVLFFVFGFFIFLKNLRGSNWNTSKRYFKNSSNPWVALDQGFDPTIESSKEDS